MEGGRCSGQCRRRLTRGAVTADRSLGPGLTRARDARARSGAAAPWIRRWCSRGGQDDMIGGARAARVSMYSRMAAFILGSVTTDSTLTAAPQRGHRLMSMSNTWRRRCIRLIGVRPRAGAGSSSRVPAFRRALPDRDPRHLRLGRARPRTTCLAQQREIAPCVSGQPPAIAMT